MDMTCAAEESDTLFKYAVVNLGGISIKMQKNKLQRYVLLLFSLYSWLIFLYIKDSYKHCAH